MNEGSNTVRNVTGQTEVGPRILLAMGGGLARRLPKLGAEAVPVLTSARDSDGLPGGVVTTTSG